MAIDDRGIVVGITTYPNFSPLDGPENDANEFYDWLVSPTGGNVPPGRVDRIVSSSFQPPKPAAAAAQPTSEIIENAFRSLQASAIGPNGVPRRLGRRLYVYVAGHGVGLPFIYDPDQSDAALLTADATQWDAPHVMARIQALYFLNAAIFDEIAVFMDCCRVLYNRLTPRFPTYIDINAIGGPSQRRTFFAFATKWAMNAREKPIGGKTHGIFTATLLKGLRTAGGNEAGTITSTSLRNYLLNHMRDLLSPAEIADPDIPKEPYIPAPSVDLIFGTTPVPSATVRISTSSIAARQTIRIRGYAFKVIASSNVVEGVPWEVVLPRGGYLVEIPGLGIERDFTLVGDEGVINVVLP